MQLEGGNCDRFNCFMEAMAFEGYKRVTPAVFENSMKAKYAQDEESSRMLEIIRESISFDFERLFNSQLDSITWYMFRSVVDGNENWIAPEHYDDSGFV